MDMDSTGVAPLIFYSYAHEDEKHLKALRNSFSLLKREGKKSLIGTIGLFFLEILGSKPLSADSKVHESSCFSSVLIS
jgi:hypothetical protein